jgi:hypothetical protein
MGHSVHNVDFSKLLAHMTQYTWSVVERQIGHTAKLSKIKLVEKLTLNSLETALLDIPAVSMPIARSRKT